jgi:leucyl/phenylalanyl-tRNA--protein transferase
MGETVPGLSPVIRLLREHPDAGDLLFVGEDLGPRHLLDGYRSGIFPMEVDLAGETRIGWFSPALRGVFRLKGTKDSPRSELRLYRSLRKALANFEIRVDSAFSDVVSCCASVRPEGNWISASYLDHYMKLFEMGSAHSVEAYLDGKLAGGLFGVAVGGLFSGESMFHLVPNASKAAFIGLVSLLDTLSFELIDGQWLTSHLETLGFVGCERLSYLLDLSRVTSVRTEKFRPGLQIEKGLWPETIAKYRRQPEPPTRRL